MKTSFLEYYQHVLDQVRFDVDLFKKEYRKAKRYLTVEEQMKLDEWISNKQWSAGIIPTIAKRSALPRQRLPYS